MIKKNFEQFQLVYPVIRYKFSFHRPFFQRKKGHCPKCRTLSKERWIEARKAELLPTGYFHLVFTLPHDLNPIIHCNPKALLGSLFSRVKEALQAFAADAKWRALGGAAGVIDVLHTWSQTVMDQFHLHCLVPAGVVL